MKDTKQTSIDIEDYVKTLEEKLEKGFTGKIKEILPITNKTYFKGSGAFDEKDGFAVVVVVDQDGQEFSNWFSKPNVRGYEQSNLKAFKKRYGHAPKVNMIVNVIIDDNGFYRIEY